MTLRNLCKLFVSVAVVVLVLLGWTHWLGKPHIVVGQGLPEGDAGYQTILDKMRDEGIPVATDGKPIAIAEYSVMGYQTGGLPVVYAWRVASTYSPSDPPEELTGVSQPVVFVLRGDILDMSMPDDATYAEDVKELFPKNIRDLFQTSDFNGRVPGELQDKALAAVTEYVKQGF